MKPVLAVLCLLLSVPALALPPDAVVRLAPGDDRILPGPSGPWTAYSMDPGVATGEVFKTAEVHVHGVKAGQALLLLVNPIDGKVDFWLVRVGEDPPPARPDPATLKGSCACGPWTYPLTCEVNGEACLQALAGFLAGADLSVAEVKIRYTLEGLQAQLKALRARLDANGFPQVALAFAGANLKTEGSVKDEAAFLKLLAELYQGMVGKLLLDNRVGLDSQARQQDSQLR